jgi:alpha-L-fucosidase
MKARLLSAALLVAALASAQPSQPPLPPQERTRWFREAKFGMFIHWGVYSVIGRHEWARHQFQIPQAEYDNYARRFNPVNYDPNCWVEIAAGAGCRYMVITSKHHDGFSIWRSRASDYNMEITPYPGDPLKMLAEASRKKGMRLGFYHSIMDWHHQDYRPQRAWEAADPKKGGDNNRYVDFMKAQINELLTGYGDVAMLWFDGEWEHTLRDLKRDDEIYDFILGLQPNCLINDRLYERAPANRADFGTPEQFVPATGMKNPAGEPILWESCVTINRDSWGYNKYETEFKTTRDLIRMLIEVVSKGGNLLLNVGPTPDGRIQDEFVTRLEAMGRWMKVNGEAIYGTTASPFARLPFYGRATTKGSTLYLHVFQWPADGSLRVPGLKNLVHSAYLLSEPGKKLATRRDGDDILITAPAEAPDETAGVVALRLDGAPVSAPYVIRPDPKGAIRLGVESCEIEARFGQRAKLENALGHVFLTNWSRPDDVPTWTLRAPRAARYRVSVSYGSLRGGQGAEFEVAAGKSALTGKVQNTGGEWVFKTFPLGEVQLASGEQTVQVKARVKAGAAITLEKVTLTPVE